MKAPTHAVALLFWLIAVGQGAAVPLRDTPEWLWDDLQTVHLPAPRPGGFLGPLRSAHLPGDDRPGRVGAKPLARAALCLSLIPARAMEQRDFIIWSRENDISAEVLAVAINMSEPRLPALCHRDICLCAALSTLLREDTGCLRGLEPKLAEATRGVLAVYYARQHEWDSAIDADNGIAAQAARSWALVHCAEIARWRDAYEQVLRFASALPKNDGTTQRAVCEALWFVGEALRGLGRWREAASHYQDAVRFFPDTLHATSARLLGPVCRCQAGDTRRGARELDRLTAELGTRDKHYAEFARALQPWVERVASARTIAPPQPQPTLVGSMNAPFTKDVRILCVYGSDAAGPTTERLAAVATKSVKLCTRGSWRRAEAVSDRQLTEDRMRESTMMVIGWPDNNRVLKRLATGLPIELCGDTIEVGGTRYPAESTGVWFVAPNPLYPHRYVLVYASADPDLIASGFPIRLKGADYLLYGRAHESHDATAVIEIGYFKKRGPQWTQFQRAEAPTEE